MFRITIFLLFAAFALNSCSDDSPTNPGSNAEILTVKTISGARPDTLTSKYLYFSFDTDDFISPSKDTTSDWDIRLPYLYGGGKTRAIDIVLNSGTINIAGKTVGKVVDTTFDLLKTAPEDALLKYDDATNRVISIAVDGTGMFTYEPASRTLNPAPQRTLVLKTKNGTYVKVQVMSLYKNQPVVPTMTSELGYYSFRYAKSSNRNLRTN
ncbi:MAG: hypothetical protein FJ212_02610 [Ignavibacteria bacterium]|nr:hypothetical protein [Ignavibacteria bacterium]